MTYQRLKYLNKLESWSTNWRLRFNTKKCSYSIFSNCSSNQKKGLELILNGALIPRENNPKFLGIIFDELLCFNSQVEFIKKKCSSRLNLIKIISHRNWNLNKKTLINVYRALIGSVLDYSFFIWPNLANSSKNQLRIIQNKALRSILKLPFDKIKNQHTSIEKLNLLSGLGSVDSRMAEIKTNYTNQAQLNRNPLICKLIEQFIRGKNRINKRSNSLTFLEGKESLDAFGRPGELLSDSNSE